MSNLTNIDRQMLQIKSLDSDATIGLSEYTGKWYVVAEIEIGGDGLLSGVTEHESTPEAAIDAYFDRLTQVDLQHYIVTGYYGKDLRHWRWNGAAFSEVPK